MELQDFGRNYNAGGIKCSYGWCKYKSEAEGMEALENLLKNM